MILASKEMDTVYNAFLQFWSFQVEDYDLRERTGMSSYIDFINSDEFEGGNCILKGKDMYGRAFLSICYDVYGVTENNTSYKEVGTIFQRYSDNVHALAFGTNAYPNALWNDSRIRTPKDLNEFIDRCIKLLCGETVQVENFYGSDSMDESALPSKLEHTICISSIRKRILDNIQENCTLCDDLCGEVMQYI